MDETLSFKPYKKYIYAVVVALIFVLVGSIIRNSIDKTNQAAWTAFDKAQGSDELQKIYEEHKNTSAGPWIGFALANAYFGEGKYNPAGKVFLEVSKMDNSYLTPYALHGCVDSLISVGKEDEAQKYSERIKKEYPASVPAQLLEKKK